MKSPDKIKYFAYLRKSSEDKERQALSIPAQRAQLSERFATLDIEFVEEEKSAFIPYNRPKFADMLLRIRNGERSGLIAWHPDRLSRNEVDASTLTYLLRTGELKDLKFATYHFENNSPEGIWMLQMALSQSQYESAKKGRDVKRGTAQSAKSGFYPAPAPLGYLNDKFTERGKKKKRPDPERFPLVRKMFDLMLTGEYTPPQIYRIAREEWHFRSPRKGGQLARNSVYNIFSNTFYYGEFEHPKRSGIWYKGDHEPMITREEYDRIQFLLGRKGNPRPKEHKDIAYRGPMKCGECGAAITAEEKMKKLAKGGVAHYTYYHCTKRKNPNCSQRSIEEVELEKQIGKELVKLEIPPEFTKWAVARLKDQNAKEVGDRELIYSAQRKDYEASVCKIDNLIDMRAGGEIDEQEFRSRKATALAEKERAQGLLQDTDKRVENWLEVAERGFNFAEKAPAVFAKAAKEEDFETCKEIFAALGSNYTLTNGELKVSLDDLLFPIQKIADAIRDLPSALEPRENNGDARDFEQLYAESPRLLPDLDSNQDTQIQSLRSYH